MITLILKILPSLELGISVGSGGTPGLSLRSGISRGYAKGELGLKEGEDYARGWLNVWATDFQCFHAVLLGRRFGKQQQQQHFPASFWHAALTIPSKIWPVFALCVLHLPSAFH